MRNLLSPLKGPNKAALYSAPLSPVQMTECKQAGSHGLHVVSHFLGWVRLCSGEISRFLHTEGAICPTVRHVYASQPVGAFDPFGKFTVLNRGHVQLFTWMCVFSALIYSRANKTSAYMARWHRFNEYEHKYLKAHTSRFIDVDSIILELLAVDSCWKHTLIISSSTGYSFVLFFFSQMLLSLKFVWPSSRRCDWRLKIHCSSARLSGWSSYTCPQNGGCPQLVLIISLLVTLSYTVGVLVNYWQNSECCWWYLDSMTAY